MQVLLNAGKMKNFVKSWWTYPEENEKKKKKHFCVQDTKFTWSLFINKTEFLRNI